MSPLIIRLIPDPILRIPAHSITRDALGHAETQSFIDQMIATMHHANGVGLAANQVGDLRQICIVDDGHEQIVMVNPIITRHSWAKEVHEEGCLSIPLTVGLVKRPKRVTVTYLDRQGRDQIRSLDQLLARIAQHEIDHLNGILFTDRTKKVFTITPDETL